MAIKRRDALKMISGLTGALAVGCATGETKGAKMTQTHSPTDVRLPTVFVPHGGGPWPYMDVSRFGAPDMYEPLSAYLKGIPQSIGAKAKAILVVSAHWEASVPTVLTAPHPKMLYDYNGFPPETYQVQWPAPGAPELAQTVRGLLEKAGIQSAEDSQRGFDHGTFVPLGVAYPTPQLPTLQLSLKRGLDPQEHLAIGRALAPLRSQGVLIVGSGMSYHNMQGFFGRVPNFASDSKRFDDWLASAVAAPVSERNARLEAWSSAPAARACHPREEHLLPLMVVAGAGGSDAATLPYRGTLMGVQISAVQFG